MCPLTIILILFSEANFAATFAVLFSTGSSIISNFEISHLISLASFSMIFLSPIKTGSINPSSKACLVDSI